MAAGRKKTTAELEAFVASRMGSKEVPREGAAVTSPRSSEAPLAPIARSIGATGADAFAELQRARADLAAEREKWAEAERTGVIILEIEPDRIVDSPFRDRDERSLSGNELSAFASDIAANGQLIPIEVRPSKGQPGKYEIVHGHRRHRACSTLGRKVRALVRESDDIEAVRRMEIENSKRMDLSPIEKARKYRALVDAGLMTQSRIVEDFGLAKGHVSQLLTIATLPDAVLGAFDDPRRLTQLQAYGLAVALRDPALRERALRDVTRLKESSLPIEARLAYLKDPEATLDTAATGRGDAAVVEHRTESGRLLAALTRQGKRRAIRFAPDTEPSYVDFVWEHLPRLREEYERNRR